MKLRYFGKIIDGRWEIDRHPETLTHTRQVPTFKTAPDGSRVMEDTVLPGGRTAKIPVVLHRTPQIEHTTDTQVDFVFTAKGGKRIRIARPFRPDREDAPTEIRGILIQSVRADSPLPTDHCAEAVYADGDVERVSVLCGEDSEAKRRARTNRRNGQGGGRPTKDDPGVLEDAVRYARDRIKAGLSVKRACEVACRKYELSIQPETLRRHVEKQLGAVRMK